MNVDLIRDLLDYLQNDIVLPKNTIKLISAKRKQKLLQQRLETELRKEPEARQEVVKNDPQPELQAIQGKLNEVLSSLKQFETVISLIMKLEELCQKTETITPHPKEDFPQISEILENFKSNLIEILRPQEESSKENGTVLLTLMEKLETSIDRLGEIEATKLVQEEPDTGQKLASFILAYSYLKSSVIPNSKDRIAFFVKEAKKTSRFNDGLVSTVAEIVEKNWDACTTPYLELMENSNE